MGHISNDLKKYENVIRCPECWQNSVVFSEEKRSCLFCRKEFEISDFIEHYGDAFLSYDDMGMEFSECPNCGESSVAFAEEIDSIICLSCNSNFNEYLKCIDCGELFTRDSNDPICTDCVQNRFDNDQMLPAPKSPEE